MELKVNEERVLIKNDLSELKNFIDSFKHNNLFFIFDNNVYKHYGEEFKKMFKVSSFLHIDINEDKKNMKTLLYLAEELINMGINRGDTLVLVGGGVLLDLGSFLASMLYRGIKHILIPTTLLSMVDASVGGKTGVDFLGHKNILGAFKEPLGVYISPYFLKTLALDELKSGIGEVIKYYYLSESFSLDYLLNKDYLNLIKESICTKAIYVEADLYDKGLRMYLNLGHTFGHAIELKYNLKHGIAVLNGIKLIMELEINLGLISKAVLTDYLSLVNSFDISLLDLDYHLFLEDIFKDKKNIGGTLNLIFIDGKKPYIYKIKKEDLKCIK